VNVTGTTVGVKNNTSGALTSTEGGTANTATATITVTAPAGAPLESPQASPAPPLISQPRFTG
jgi:hypothetical protein